MKILRRLMTVSGSACIQDKRKWFRDVHFHLQENDVVNELKRNDGNGFSALTESNRAEQTKNISTVTRTDH